MSFPWKIASVHGKPAAKSSERRETREAQCGRWSWPAPVSGHRFSWGAWTLSLAGEWGELLGLPDSIRGLDSSVLLPTCRGLPALLPGCFCDTPRGSPLRPGEDS